MAGQSVPHPRFKLSQAMYQKLKIFIMSKRRRMMQEKELDAQIDRRKRDREERRRQKEVEKSKLQSTVEQIETLTKRLEELRKQKQEAFSKFKTIVNEENKQKIKQKEEADALINMSMQFASGPVPSVSGLSRSAAAAPPHPQTMYMQAQPPTHMLHSRATPAGIYANPPAAHQQPTVAKPAPQPAPPSVSHSSSGAAAAPSHSLIPAKRRRSPSPPPPFKQAGGPVSASFSAGHATVPSVAQQQSNQQAAAAAVASAVAAQPSQAKNPLLMDGPLGYHMHLYRNSHAAAAAASGRGIPSVTSSPASNSNYGKALPPAPTSYRGSITTGQSAQQIQLQQAAALHTTLQQFQAAAAVQQQQQQQQQHIPKTLPSSVAVSAAGYPTRPGAPPPGTPFPPTTQAFSTYPFPAGRRYPPY